MPRRVIPSAIAIALGAVALAFVFFLRPTVDAGLLQPDDAELVALGAEIYDAHCAVCHGADLEGEPNWRQRDAEGFLPAPPHDETGHTWHHPDQVLIDLTRHGLEPFAGPDYRSRMPAYDDILTDREIVAVLSYIKSRWPEEIRRRHDELNARAAGLD